MQFRAMLLRNARIGENVVLGLVHQRCELRPGKPSLLTPTDSHGDGDDPAKFPALRTKPSTWVASIHRYGQSPSIRRSAAKPVIARRISASGSSSGPCASLRAKVHHGIGHRSSFQVRLKLQPDPAGRSPMTTRPASYTITGDMTQPESGYGLCVGDQLVFSMRESNSFSPFPPSYPI